MIRIDSYQIKDKEITYNYKDLWQISTGQINVISGKNAIGKSTLLNGLYDNFKNTNTVIKMDPSIKLIDAIEVRDNIKLHASLTKDFNLNQFYIDLEIFKLAQYLDYKVKDLSFGTQKKILLLLMLNSSCEFLFLDEPFIGLDYDSVSKMVKLLKQTCHEKYIVLVEHDLDVLKQYDSNILNLNEVI